MTQTAKGKTDGENPRPRGDGQFHGKWLLRLARLKTKAYSDQEFAKQIDRVCMCCIPDFGIAATALTNAGFDGPF
jgi:hypothetical protein